MQTISSKWIEMVRLGPTDTERSTTFDSEKVRTYTVMSPNKVEVLLMFYNVIKTSICVRLLIIIILSNTFFITSSSIFKVLWKIKSSIIMVINITN